MLRENECGEWGSALGGEARRDSGACGLASGNCYAVFPFCDSEAVGEWSSVTRESGLRAGEQERERPTDARPAALGRELAHRSYGGSEL